MEISWWNEIKPEIQAELSALNFDPVAMEELRQKVLSGEYSQKANYCRPPPVPPEAEHLAYFPTRESASYRYFYELGIKALAAGRVGVAILNGGMATRFGGVVKGALEVNRERSFLKMKIDDVRLWQERLNVNIPVFIINSFATDAATKEHLLGEKEVKINYLKQGVGLRLSPAGEIFWPEPGRPSLYAPGHGDMLRAWLGNEEAMAWSRADDHILLIGNVDNIYYTINPVIIGIYISQNRPLLAEMVEKRPGDVGGAPAWYNNKLQTIEGFRFPPDFDQEQIHVFATNSFVIKASELTIEREFTWFYVLKEAHGRKLLQLEKLINQLTAYINTTFLVAPRLGEDGRFFPVKTAMDMDKARKSFLA